MFTRSEVIVLRNKQADAADNIQRSSVLNYSKTTRSILFIDVSALRRKPSSGLTFGAGRQYVKACPKRGSVGSSPHLAVRYATMLGNNTKCRSQAIACTSSESHHRSVKMHRWAGCCPRGHSLPTSVFCSVSY